MRSDSGGGEETFVIAKKQPWSVTLITQAVLCFFLFVAFNIGQSQIKINTPLSTGEDLRFVRRDSDDFYFISVTGGSRPLGLQSRLLKQMEKTAKMYKSKFVLNIGEIGEDDPLLNNATLHIELLKIPWYTTAASKGQLIGNFMKKFKLPFNQVLEIIGVDTGPLQDIMHLEKNSTDFKEQMDWLQRILTFTSSNWRIVVGFDPLAICDETYSNIKKSTKLFHTFHDIFTKHGVDAYISTKGCVEYISDENVIYLGAPTQKDENKSQVHNGFFLHRINGIIMETYLVDSEGRVVLESGFTQRERGSESI